MRCLSSGVPISDSMRMSWSTGMSKTMKKTSVSKRVQGSLRGLTVYYSG